MRAAFARNRQPTPTHANVARTGLQGVVCVLAHEEHCVQVAQPSSDGTPKKLLLAAWTAGDTVVFAVAERQRSWLSIYSNGDMMASVELPGPVASLSAHRRAREVYVGVSTGGVRVFDGMGRLVRELAAGLAVTTAAVSAVRNSVLVADGSVVHVLDFAGESTMTATLPAPPVVLAPHPGGEFVFAGFAGGARMQVLHISNFTVAGFLNTGSVRIGSVDRAAFTPTGRELRIVDLTREQVLRFS